MPERSPYIQNISWLKDLNSRGLLNMEPGYQRRSVWTDKYREDFVDTILMDYPAPAIFLYEIVNENGITSYDLVDGKQRLTTIFEFLTNKFSVGDRSPIEELRGLYFDSIGKERKIAFYKYKFTVEVLPSAEEEVINNIFDRLNRNTMKLTPQELRHAKFDGLFITASESLSLWLAKQFDKEFPKIATTSRKQQKDVEIVATLLLYLEHGPKSYSTNALDKAFAERDDAWESADELETEFREIIGIIKCICADQNGEFLLSSRFRNQADFYSLFAAISELKRSGILPSIPLITLRLNEFDALLNEEGLPRVAYEGLCYLDAARSASNDAGPRKIRIEAIKRILLGEPLRDSI